MPSFQSMFEASKGQPIVYDGRELALMDRLPVAKQGRLQLVFESVNSDYPQGVVLETKGTFEVNNLTIKKGLKLWQRTAPAVVAIDFASRDGLVLVWNIWDHGDGGTQAWHHGAAMIVEELPSGRRYRCNDGHPDDNFDDLVFSIERL